MAFGSSGCLRCWCNGRHLPDIGPRSLHSACAVQGEAGRRSATVRMWCATRSINGNRPVRSRAPRFPSAPRLSGACAGRTEVATCRESQRSHGPVRCRCNGGSRLSFARSFTLALQRCDHETRNHCGGGRHIGDRCGERQPLHDVGSCPRATIAARETGGGDRAAGCRCGSTCAGAVAQPACATGLG